MHLINDCCKRTMSVMSDGCVDLLQMYITNSTQKGDIVLDPFFSSGSTAKACLDTGLEFIDFEIDTDVYFVTYQRLQIMPQGAMEENVL